MAESNYSNSFIPKDEHTKQVRNHIERIRNYLNALMAISVTLFTAAIIVAVGSYLYGEHNESQLTKLQEDLKQETLDADDEIIKELNRFDTRLKVARQLLEDHKLVTPLLYELEKYVLEVVQLKSVSLDSTADFKLELSGQGESLNYQSLATQSDAFSESKYFSNPIFTSFERNEDDFISFNFVLTVDDDITKAINNEADDQVSEEDLISYLRQKSYE